MEREIEVHIDWNGGTRPVGRLWARAKSARQTCSFAYAPTWLGLAGAFALDPEAGWALPRLSAVSWPRLVDRRFQPRTISRGLPHRSHAAALGLAYAKSTP